MKIYNIAFWWVFLSMYYNKLSSNFIIFIIIIIFYYYFFFPLWRIWIYLYRYLRTYKFLNQIKSRNDLADALYRQKIPASQGYIEDEVYVQKVTVQVVLLALRVEQIDEASAQDEDL